MRRCILHLPLAAGFLLATATAQRVRIVAPVGAIAPQRSPEEDVGVPVEMFENPNLDRYLRRAQSFLDSEKYDAAIQVLQDVIEGRTVEAVDSPPEKPVEGSAPEGGTKPAKDEKDKEKDKTAEKPAATGVRATSAQRQAAGNEKQPAERPRSIAELDAAKSVFSQDGRLYRPVRRLCHELLSRLPTVGIEIYRTSYEVTANEMFQQALRDGSISAIEQVANRYFITLPAGRAMVVLADRLMHEGRYRAAVQVLRDLVEVYPDDNRKRLGVSEVWCKFKIALCLRLAGEVAAAHAAVRELAEAHPDESLRILGELHSVRDLPQAEAFANEVLAVVADRGREKGATWLTPTTETLVPLWQYRFKNPEPYREPKATNDGNQPQWGEGARMTTMPHASRNGPATWVRFAAPDATRSPPQVMFLEHFRLRMAETLTGNQTGQSDGVDEPPNPRENHPRVRIAATDFALLRPVEDEARRYVVMGHTRNSIAQTPDVLKASELVAYDRGNFERTWSSAQWLDGEDGLRDVTFLAAPTIYGERLLMPAMRRDAYSLECLDRSTGRPLWHTMLHAGGSPYFKAPGSPVTVHGGIAFVITNAGCLAAVDAFAGDLRWIRRYERDDPLRPRPRAKRSGSGEQVYGTQFVQNEIPGFLPNDLIVSNGLVVMAPCDGSMLLCIDGATGQPVWWLDAATRYAPYGNLRMLVGATDEDLFALSEKNSAGAAHLVCISLQGGLVRWARDLPQWNGLKNSGRGRGTIVGDQVVVPGEREILVFDTAGKQPMRRLALPAYGTGREPLSGSINLVSSGPWLAVGYQGGVELFSSEAALRQLAKEAGDPVLESSFLMHAGDVAAAAEVLARWLGDPALPAAVRSGTAAQQAAVHLVALTRELAMQNAKAGKVAEALEALDRLRPLVVDKKARLNWHLARLEVCKEGGDLRGHEQEQQRLYDFMEGKG
ncbi:MAG: PQQ-binding-like beta-propeller repeat protein [Planctomycetota bacterium]|nr:PQQ-binding-like beta-propeller repeat protein [Planctomycetota bacterium]